MDNEILSRLYRMYSREIYLYLYSMCGDPALAEDLMQETFLKALLSLNSQHTNMRAWLYRVARNLFYDHRKAASRQKVWEGIDQLADTGQNISVPKLIPGTGQRRATSSSASGAGGDLLDQVIASEEKRALYRAMSRLEPRRREILVLQYYGGLSQKEIAQLLHLSPENVRVLAFRGKRELRKYLEADAGGNGN